MRIREKWDSSGSGCSQSIDLSSRGKLTWKMAIIRMKFDFGMITKFGKVRTDILGDKTVGGYIA